MIEQYLLIDMTDYRIKSVYDSQDAADAARENAGKTPVHVMPLGGDWNEFSAVDMMRLYNTLPGIEHVKRFENRATALRRTKEALASLPGLPPVYLATPPIETETTTTSQENPQMPATSKRRSTKTAKEKTTEALLAIVALTAKGQKDDVHFNTGSARGKVYEAIKRHDGKDGIPVPELTRRCSNFANRSQVLGCIDKLVRMGLAKRSN